MLAQGYPCWDEWVRRLCGAVRIWMFPIVRGHFSRISVRIIGCWCLLGSPSYGNLPKVHRGSLLVILGKLNSCSWGGKAQGIQLATVKHSKP